MTPTPDASKWDELGAEYDSWRTARYDPRTYRAIFDQVPTPCRLAVDVGCGAGLLTAEIAAHAGLVVGFDISWGMLLLARRRHAAGGVGNVRLVVADAEHPPLADRRADLVLSINVLHHTDLDVSLSRLADVLRPGGRLAARIMTVRFPRASQWLAVRAAYSLRAAASTFLHHPFAEALRLTRFFFNPRWIRGGQTLKLTRARLAQEVARLLPDSRVERAWHGAADILWTKPR